MYMHSEEKELYALQPKIQANKTKICTKIKNCQKKLMPTGPQNSSD